MSSGTVHSSSNESKSSSTTRIALNESSLTGSLVLLDRMLGARTRARLAVSMRLLASCVATHWMNKNRTSSVSRCVRGSMQHARCSTRLRATGSLISSAHVNKPWSLYVKSGSGSSLRNFLMRAAICTGFSANKSTSCGFLLSASVSSFNRLMLPFFLKMPSTETSEK